MDSQTSLGQAVAAGTSTGEVSADDQEESVFDEEGLLFGDGEFSRVTPAIAPGERYLPLYHRNV